MDIPDQVGHRTRCDRWFWSVAFREGQGYRLDHLSKQVGPGSQDLSLEEPVGPGDSFEPGEPGVSLGPGGPGAINGGSGGFLFREGQGY
ncbi:hypothetical protein CEXT_398011 [Caerostris extrusa]|uniref:Uncharacterized protein n=1 Tax=Caerostris extrusa TaxID=172846 RepID=A0AAV4XVQ4_CAEEX|nr:hypothetical protein CEXT_398011 [Caerostris extrusa]